MRDLEKYNKHIEEEVIVNREYPTDPRFKDLTGNTFGRLKVLNYAGKNLRGDKYFLCECECRNKVYVRGDSLTCGRTVSCGCYSNEVISNLINNNYSHGKSDSRLYRIYQNMIHGCYNSTEPIRKHTYMDNNIDVCDEWLLKSDGFKNFYEWAYEKANPKYTDYYETHLNSKIYLSRIDFNKGFSPDNCRFCTAKVLFNNTRRNTYKRYKNYVFSLSIWAEILEIPYEELRYRNRRHWTDYELITTPYDPSQIGTIRAPEPNESFIPNIADKYLIHNKYDEFCKVGIIEPQWNQFKSFDKEFDEIPTGTYISRGIVRNNLM